MAQSIDTTEYSVIHQPSSEFETGLQTFLRSLFLNASARIIQENDYEIKWLDSDSCNTGSGTEFMTRYIPRPDVSSEAAAENLDADVSAETKVTTDALGQVTAEYGRTGLGAQGGWRP